MIKLLTTYIAHEFAKFFLLMIAAFTLIILVGNLFSNIGDVFKSTEAFIQYLKETALMLPKLWELLIPLTVLLATMATFNTLNRASEVVAMRSAGMGFVSLAKPVILVCLVIAFINYANQNYLYRFLQKWWNMEESGEQLPVFWTVGNKAIYYLGYRTPPDQVRDVTIFEWVPSSYLLQSKTQIKSGKRDQDQWNFQNVQIREFLEQRLRLDSQPQLRVAAAQMPVVPFHPPISPHHQPLLDLYDDIQRRKQEGQEVTEHWLELHLKLATPVSLLVMVLIGLALSLTHSRRGGNTENMALAFLLGVLFLLSGQILTALGSAAVLAPMLAAWVVNAVFFLIALALFRLMRS